jgi:hypothetical protein
MPLRRVSGTFKLAEKIIAGDRPKANVGLLPGTTGAVSFAVLVDSKPVHGLGVDH